MRRVICAVPLRIVGPPRLTATASIVTGASCAVTTRGANEAAAINSAGAVQRVTTFCIRESFRRYERRRKSIQQESCQKARQVVLDRSRLTAVACLDVRTHHRTRAELMPGEDARSEHETPGSAASPEPPTPNAVLSSRFHQMFPVLSPAEIDRV